ncbi:metalloregulator ArsR/SmtB family transcription factor [Microbacterium hominis]|uniref:Metalloregulator ArsR/SmtB family transcription factor n=1 Tax=Microbacterium hominis TaxID=162426 RepID=A0A7D4TE68_9MICO|nr:metalloregulator ArsR/SmtB family transcription factor [Microbacterium hominis]QKJ18740.1 metalloregulator ArsR/SmtB family transcription factor [Microbacterium hominis]
MDAQTVDRSLAVLADPTRARIVGLIRDADEERALVGGLAKSLGLTQPTVSHHMRMLLTEGVVQRTRDGRRVWYSIDPDARERVAAMLGAPAVPPRTPDLERISRDLARRFRGTFSAETVAHYVDDSHRLLAARGPISQVASRTAAFAASRLDALARARHPGGGVPEVLFVCVQNAGRSQLASAILRHLAGGRVMVRTAGSAPGGEVRSAIVTALDEIGVPLGGEFPKPLTDEAVKAADVVITMGCGDACPIYPGRTYLDWELADPVGRPLEEVRAIRDDIDTRVRALIADLDIERSSRAETKA